MATVAFVCGARARARCVRRAGRGGWGAAHLHIESDLPRARTGRAQAEQVLRELRGVRWNVVLEELVELLRRATADERLREKLKDRRVGRNPVVLNAAHVLREHRRQKHVVHAARREDLLKTGEQTKEIVANKQKKK